MSEKIIERGGSTTLIREVRVHKIRDENELRNVLVGVNPGDVYPFAWGASIENFEIRIEFFVWANTKRELLRNAMFYSVDIDVIPQDVTDKYFDGWIR